MNNRPRFQMLARVSIVSLVAIAASTYPAAAIQERTEEGSSTEKKAAKPTLPADWVKSLSWRSIGPANMGGRITAIAVYEKDPCLWWVASASGLG